MKFARLSICLTWLLLSFPALAVTAAVLERQAKELASAADAAEQAGIVLPSDLTMIVGRSLSATNLSEAERDRLAESLQQLSVDLEMRRFSPGRLGDYRLNLPAAFGAGEEVDFALRYTLGQALEPGAAIMVARHWSYGAVLQNVDETAPNYVSLQSSRADAGFVAARTLHQGLHGGRNAAAALPMFELASGRLAEGDVLTISYRNLQLPSRAFNRFVMPIYVRFRSGAGWSEIPATPFPLGAGTAATLTAYAPMTVAPGEDFPVALKLTDNLGNLATGQIPSLEVSVNGNFSTRVPAGNDPAPLFSLRLQQPGTHEIEIRSAGGGLRSSLSIQVERLSPFSVRWVELHAHTDAGDGLSSRFEIEEQLLGAVDEVFVMDSDHYLSPGRWQARNVGLFDGFVRSSDLKAGGHSLLLSSVTLDVSPSPVRALPGQRQFNAAINARNSLVVALPEVPADPRVVHERATRLAEIRSGPGTFEWFGNRIARAGFRVGFTGTATSHTPLVGDDRPGRTAVMVRKDEPLFDALHAGRTYVTTGARMFVDVSVNGGAPGERVPDVNIRRISGQVIGTAPIHSIELIRNGEVIETRRLAQDTESQVLRVAVNSASEPLNGQHDLPRNGREWLGYIRLVGGGVAGFDAPGFSNPARQAIAVNPSDRNRVDFLTWTRGGASSFLLEIDGQSEDIVVEANLGGGIEDSDLLPLTRLPAEIPPTRLVVTWPELLAGEVVRAYNVAGYHDSVTFELVDTDAPASALFEFTDRRDHGSGDYYYLRIYQLDDHVAWTSPVWVGGFDPE